MADRVLIEVVSQSEGLDEANAKLQQLTQREKELIAQMDSLAKQKQQWQGSTVAVAAFDKEIGKTNAELQSTRKSIEDLSKATKAMPGKVAAEEVTKSLKAQRTELMNMLGNWSDWSEAGKKAYEENLEKAGELDDKMRDLQNQIRFMGSDTAAFDAVLEGTQAVAGGFSVAQGAAALFGVESEDLQKMMVKLQAAIAITTGLQQIQNAVQKESNIMTGISVIQTKAKAAAEALSTKGTIAAAAAQKVLNLVAAANPYVLLATAIISVVGALALFSIGADEASEKAKKYKSTTDDLRFATKEARDEHDKFVNSIRDIQIEIDLATGKITKYQAALLRISNATGDAIKEVRKKTEEEVNKVNESYDGFFKKLGKSFVNSMKGNQEAASFAGLEKEQQNKILEIKKKGAEEEAGLQEQGYMNLEAKNQEYNEEILRQNEDLHNENLKGLQGSLAKIETERRREVESAKAHNQEIIEINKTRPQNEQLVLNDIEAINKKYDDRVSEARKSEADRIKSENDKRKNEITKAEQDLATERIKAMQDGEEKEIASVRQALERRLDEIKGNSQAEIDLRKQLEDNAQDEIKKIEDKYKNQRLQSEIETEIAITNASLAEVEKGSDAELELRRQLLEEKAKLDVFEIEKSTDSEELKAARILEINTNLKKDLKNLSVEYIKTADERSKAEVLAVTQSYEKGKINKFQYEKQLNDISIKSLEDEIAERKSKGEETVDLEQKLSEKRKKIADEEKEYRKQVFEELYSAMGETANAFFDMHKQGLDREMEDLQHYYTTDAEEAKKNKDMKLISEDEMNKRQLEIKRKQAQSEKDQALFNAFLSMATGIAKALSAAPPPFNIALAAITAAAAMVQIKAITSKPLPKYWKGRKGGKGEFALLGEYGPEIAWIPSGASVMPAHDTRRAVTGDNKAFYRWNMPRIEPNYPVMPRVPQQLIKQYYQNRNNEDRIDYDLLGKSVAKYMKFPKYPKQKDVTVNFDKSGLSLTEGNTTTKVLNSKYSANV
ncbi:MAG: hypothetical protein FWF53_06945 [Candidatus Azobacteroides sp.]|nr:hypothetical protein [Candidatus Azobacteroides sp.]